MSNLDNNEYTSKMYIPSEGFAKNANICKNLYQSLLSKADSNYEEFWAEFARSYINWHKPFNKILNKELAPFYKWFEDGLLNVSYNCLDKNAQDIPNKVAIIFESDSGDVEKITYKELYTKVCQFANGLKKQGVKKGDRVIIYMPNTIEAVIAIQASCRIGAIHSVVFGGFSAYSLSERISDVGAVCIITSITSNRGGKLIKLKDNVDEALTILSSNHSVKSVIVKQLNIADTKKIEGLEFIWNKDRDIWWNDLIANQNDTCEPEIVDSEHPLFILYTSGSTGRPKGVQHSSAGYLLGAILTMKWVLDIKPKDIFWCTADVGWITGHTYVAYGPLAVGATQVIFEGIPTYPDASRYWQMINKYKVSVFYTAPTAIRTLIKLGANLPKQYDLSSLRLLGSVGEPINPEVWKWYYKEVGNSKCPIVDTWWQTETGCHMMSPIPAVTALKSGSCVGAIPGIMVDILDDLGNSVANGEKGYLVITKPFPSQLRTIWGNNDRYKAGYYKKEFGNEKYYVAGDFAYRDHDGYFWILGRSDDVLNVSGHRLSTMEVESALVENPKVVEAAVVGIPHDIKGEAIVAFVVLKTVNNKVNSLANDVEADSKQSIAKLQSWITSLIGAIAKPEIICLVENLPKTRSGKVMRRLLKSIANGEEITGDISTLDNPLVVEQIQKQFLKK